MTTIINGKIISQKINIKGYTKIPNDILAESQLTIQARYLLCVLIRHCGKDDWCFQVSDVRSFWSPV